MFIWKNSSIYRFWTYLDSVKLFNIFLTVLIIDSTYKTNKYMFHLLEIMSLTSIEMTYSTGFAVLECEKRIMLHRFWKCVAIFWKTQKYDIMIVTDLDISLMNYVTKLFPLSHVLLCRYHITKNVRDIIKWILENK